MNLDPRTIIITNIVGSLMMGICLLIISRGPMAKIPGFTRWALATLLQSAGWLVLGALRGVVPDIISVVLGNALLLLALAFYFNIIAEFKNKTIPAFWAYSIVLCEAIVLTYFLLVIPDNAARIASVSGSSALLMFGAAYLLLYEKGNRPVSHILTGFMFAFCGSLLTIRSVNSLVWDTDPNQLPFYSNPMQNLSYLIFYITSVMLTFGFVLMSNDKYITERKEMAEALEESEEEIKTIFKNAPDAIIVINEGSLITEWNPMAETIFGWKKEAVIGKNLYEIIIPKRLREPHIKGFKQFLKIGAGQGSGKLGEITALHANNSEFEAGVSISPTMLKDKFSLICFITDISDSKKAKETIVQTNIFIKSILENIPNMIFVKDAKELRFVLFNKAGEKLLGHSEQDLIGKNDYDFFPKEQADFFISKDLEVVRNQGILDIPEELIDTKNGKRWLHTQKIAIRDAKNNPLYLLGISEDITESKIIEKELKDALEKAKESVILKEQFLANMSHEIRTPMNAIVGFTQLLQETKITAEQKEWLNIIKSSGENLLVIVNDILDFSKMEAGKLEFEENKIDIADLVQSSIALLLPKAEKKDIGLFFFIDKKIPSIVLGDAVRLTQILLNLISNAIIYTNRGKVDLKVHLVNETNKNVTVDFLITDTGIGIEEDKIKNIFESFTQVSGGTARKYGGTGLGLTISKRLVEQQGGKLTVKSKFREGSCFAFTLSFKKTEENIKVAETTLKGINIEGVADLNILVVEDNPVNQQLLITILSKWKINVDIADNGKLAITKLTLKKYDLILMDIQIPEMDGYETTHYIRESLLSNIPIIAMTAHAMKGEAKKCIQCGMNDYISKPFDPNDLLAKVIHHSKGIPGTHEPSKEITTLNLDYLKEITADDTQLLIEMLNVFIKNTPSQLEALENELNKQNWLELKAMAHKLKSNVGVMGLNDCMPMLNTIENNAINKVNLDTLPSLVKRVKQKCNEALELLRIEVAKLSET